MTTRSAPAVALWLLGRFACGYRRESLLGDLIEQNATGKSRRWLWRQVAAALCANGARRLRAIAGAAGAGTWLLVAAELLSVGALALLFLAWRRPDAPGVLLRLGCATAIAFVLLGLVLGSPARRDGSVAATRGRAARKLLAAFAVLALGTATLTWAGTAVTPTAAPAQTVDGAGAR